MDQKIINIRQDIDTIDKKIISLLEERIVLVNKIGKLKSANQDVSYIKADREYSMVRNLIRLSSSIPSEVILQIWRNIISYSLYSEKKYEIFLLGNKQTFDKVYYLIRIYFSSLPEIAHCDPSDVNWSNAVINNPSNIIVADINDDQFIKFLKDNLQFKIFAKLDARIGEEYYAAAKIPLSCLATTTKLFLIKEVSRNKNDKILRRITIGDEKYLVVNGESHNVGALLGAYATL